MCWGSRRQQDLDVPHEEPLKALHVDGLESHWNSCGAQRDVEEISEIICQVVCTFSEHSLRDVFWPKSLQVGVRPSLLGQKVLFSIYQIVLIGCSVQLILYIQTFYHCFSQHCAL